MKFSVVKWEKIWWSISAILCIGSVIAMVISYTSIGTILRPSLDFVGGTRLQVELDCTIANNCDRPLTVNEVREILDSENLGNNSSIQIVGKDQHGISIRTKTLDVDERTKLQQILTEKIGIFDEKTIQIDTVGPTIGKELFISGFLALIVSFTGIIVYLSFRFKTDYAIFAIIALFHDVLVTTGVFAILGLVGGVEVDTLFLVALLTITGFSVNDTVVIYDRIREIAKEANTQNINEIVDQAVLQTLTRSINTSLTTLLPVVAIFLFGGETLKFFALALIVGFICGAYSSIFIASTLLGWWRKVSQKKAVTA
ncbi:MAG: protein translocase subunit SecF [Cyanobacteria bacterium]|nr:protein translocase subunit SecF [Cyanobacteria bacterium CG_2015-16_32_12]NCO78524.1 protein translocase subunit SecF [Cyanobacteria bacterium CG_2015-22_32_23]NCQ03607.1 protein translocase subunit SecF [Cyanobacteria bacterium CG_2015-09_32_10]NCQ40510.1 protein translocase subunit SecF [Cyanobacteria bacterium CG_2015-04_32_10]NCS84615.1 protein translocase subunit SecF [Cyanobacteria bacterium CG_2015-02_32_10]